MTDEYLEREDKYEVTAGFALPDVTQAAPDATLNTSTLQLEATYYDTAESHLRRHGISLRRRKGGLDDGWHLKLPEGDDRVELHSNLTSAGVPREFSSLLTGIRRGLKLAPVAKLSVTRHSHRLHDPSGGLLVEIADDHVNAVTMGEVAMVTEWREIEVELGPAGDSELRSIMGKLLLKAGARPSTSRSKVITAVGPLPVAQPREGLAGVIDDYVQAQSTAIAEGDLALRRDQNQIHPTRVAIRRLRSTLRIFDNVFETEPAGVLEAELVWLAGLLGAVRDSDVQRERLSSQVETLPGELVLGSVGADIDSTLSDERDKAWKRLRLVMNGKRYAALLGLLEQWRVDPPYTNVGSKKPKAVAKFVHRAEKKLYKRLDRAAETGMDDDLLHQARQAGKRFRYAAELTEPIMGDKATDKVKQAKKFQDVLGEFQDSVVSVDILRRLGARAGTKPGSNGFTYGVLLERELQRAEEARAAMRELHR
ncbi:MAG: CYTH and CHAD domain-containing protein [Nocardioidaceae bacterium]|nr:CYTH and CHAD domain-containing protein [Nocardioidaceae bacterium]